MRAWQVDADVASLSLAEIVMPPDTRVTSVSGADLLAWHVAIESSKPMSNSSNSVSAVTEKSVLHLQFRKSVMNDVVPIVITTELQISTGGYVCCTLWPAQQCLVVHPSCSWLHQGLVQVIC